MAPGSGPCSGDCRGRLSGKHWISAAVLRLQPEGAMSDAESPRATAG